MSSNFNLSTLVAMQEQQVQQTSVHFWRCQLSAESPRYAWNPDKLPEDKLKEKLGAATAASSKDKEEEGDPTDEDFRDEEEATTRHLLHVTGCVLGPKATGIHLVTVRTGRHNDGTKQEQQQNKQEQTELDDEACPILCMDASAQRTLALGHEFVIETSTPGASQQPQQQQPWATASWCVFELAEGTGPVWLTGTHRVHRVVTSMGQEEEEEEEEEEDDESGEEDEEAEDEEEDIPEEDEEEEDAEEEMIEEVKPVSKKKAPAAGKAGKAVAVPTAKQQPRKRSKPDS